MNRFAFLITGLTAVAATTMLFAAELSVEQRTAKTIFENNLFDAQDKLRSLKTGALKLDWKYYDQNEIQPLKEALSKCKAANVPGDTPTTVGGKTMSFADAEREAGQIEGDFKSAFGLKDDKIATFKNGQTPDNLNRYESFRQEMTKGLSGDKLRLMDEEVLVQAVVYAQTPPQFIKAYYGEGKKPLRNPQDFAAARIWATADCVYASDDTLKLDPHWRVSIYHFEGMKLVHRTEERGPGTQPPAAMFTFRAK